MPDTSHYLAVLPGIKDSVHEQCRELYGEGSFMCVSICVHYYIISSRLSILICFELYSDIAPKSEKYKRKLTYFA